MELCSICKEDMDAEQNYMLQCNHRFHTSCIIDSLRINPECPICRDTGTKQKKNECFAEQIYNNDIFSNYNYFYNMNHTNYCIHCSIKGKENQYYDIYSTLLDIIDNDNALLHKKKSALKNSFKLRRKIFMINNKVKNDIVQLWKERDRLIKEYYESKLHSDEFVNITENLAINKPLAQQFGKLLQDKLNDLNIYNDLDVVMVINYITYELFNCPYTDNNKFYSCSENCYINKLFFDKLLYMSKKNKKVNTSILNVII